LDRCKHNDNIYSEIYASITKQSGVVMKVKKVNWHDSVFKDLDTSIKKDNNGFVYGLYTFEGNELIKNEWFKSEIERDKQANNFILKNHYEWCKKEGRDTSWFNQGTSKKRYVEK
tara:strand:- start:269 stop:613 length:345 start_codon:yes stop_codon:yes gene_type:complete